MSLKSHEESVWVGKLAERVLSKTGHAVESINQDLIAELLRRAAQTRQQQQDPHKHILKFISFFIKQAKSLFPVGDSTRTFNDRLFEALNFEIVRLATPQDSVGAAAASSSSSSSVPSPPLPAPSQALVHEDLEHLEPSAVPNGATRKGGPGEVPAPREEVMVARRAKDAGGAKGRRMEQPSQQPVPGSGRAAKLVAETAAREEKTHVSPLDVPLPAAPVRSRENPYAVEDLLTRNGADALESFLRIWEIARQFKPWGPLAPLRNPADHARFLEELSSPSASCQIRNIAPLIADKLRTSVAYASSRVWRYMANPRRQPHNEISFRCFLRDDQRSGAPFRLELYAPVVDSTCRIRSHFGPDRFLRVEMDQDFCRDHPDSVPKQFDLCGRRFEFLVPRDSYCYYFATRASDGSIPEISVLQVINWQVPIEPNLDMTVNKFSTRIALGFSNILSVIRVDRTAVIPDLVSLETGVVMSDGCAPIGTDLMRKVRDSLNLPKWMMPGAVQARFGSAKGVWFLDPTVDPQTLYIRPSQVKYSTPEECDRLEVISYSKPSGPSKLNRQLVQVLDALGVPDEVFLALQEEMLSRLRARIFASDPFVTACFVERLSKGGDDPHAESPLLTKIFTMILSGFDKSEPYLHSLLSALFARQVSSLKERAKIELLHSRNVLIIADPTGKLEPGQCFLQLTHDASSSGTGPALSDKDSGADGERSVGVMSGLVAAARSPCYLASDCQLLECVDIPELRHLQEVMVLSAKGPRAAAHVFGCGDYDGDRLLVTWDPRIVESLRIEPEPEGAAEVDKRFITERVLLRDVVAIQQLCSCPQGKTCSCQSAELSRTNCRLQEHLLDIYVNSKRMLRLFSFWHLKLSDEFTLCDPRCVELGFACRRLLDSAKSGMKPSEEYVRQLEAYMTGFKVPHWYPKAALKRSVRHSDSAIACMFDALSEDAQRQQQGAKGGGHLLERRYDPHLSELLARIPKGRVKGWTRLAKELLKEYRVELEMHRVGTGKDEDVGALFRRTVEKRVMGRGGGDDKEGQAVGIGGDQALDEFALVAYGVTVDESVATQQPLDFCWIVLGDVLENLKARAMDGQFSHEGTMRPLVVPRRFVRRIMVDNQTLIHD